MLAIRSCNQTPAGKSGEVGDTPYLRYLKHMFKTRPEKGPVEKFAQGYEDYLQVGAWCLVLGAWCLVGGG